jgi:hypothetical protein
MTLIFTHHWSQFLPSRIGKFAGKEFEEPAMVTLKKNRKRKNGSCGRKKKERNGSKKPKGLLIPLVRVD